MLIGEVIQRVQSLYSKGVQSDDSRLSSRHIYNKLVTVRTKLLSQKAAKKQKISQWSYQTLPCIELVPALYYESSYLPAIGCQILKSRYPFPKLITDLNEHVIQSVTSVDGEVIYSEINWSEKKYKKANKYTASKPDFVIRNNYLFVTHKNGPKIITATGLFEDPIEAENYPRYCPDTSGVNPDCINILDKRFPMEDELIDTLIEVSANELIVLFSKGVEDLTNNSEDSIPEQSK